MDEIINFLDIESEVDEIINLLGIELNYIQQVDLRKYFDNLNDDIKEAFLAQNQEHDGDYNAGYEDGYDDGYDDGCAATIESQNKLFRQALSELLEEF